MLDRGRSEVSEQTIALLQAAELKAEQLVAILRLIISTTLGTVFLVVLTLADVPISDVLRWQLIYAVATMAAYFLLGTASLVLLALGAFRQWMIWPSATGDCLFILLSIWLSVANTGLPGSYMVVYPTVWLVPMVLACGALRFNPQLQAYIALLIILGLIWLLGRAGAEPEAVSAELTGFFFAGPPNYMRIAMIALASGVLVLASWRIRQLLIHATAEAQRRANLTRFLPDQLATGTRCRPCN